ncbi:hypothetical protein GGD54_002458 [Rhizobium tropici]|uniref:Uncharacterized protein n=1 Tax=Rhizobium tropici TaxID=398 RepID=A0ABR6QYN7_RHITR|nr:hypothetical protein [Rhizobium tropici]MBB5593624.1 hypothetical protein [Rhizobium tropici]MBB6492054.1 hypothetical protein [Rhizobium tropici]
MNDVATIASPQAAHRSMYEPPWTIDSVLSNPHEVQTNVSLIASPQCPLAQRRATTEFDMRSKKIDAGTLLSVPYRHENPAYAAKLSFAEHNAQRLPIDGLNTMRLSISKST